MSKQQQPSLSGQFDAWVRQGAKDLHNAIIPAFPQSAHSVDEIGTPMNPTPQMVTQDLDATQDYYAMLDRYAAHGRDKGQDRGIER